MSDQSDDEPKVQEATAVNETPAATPEVKVEEKVKPKRSEKQLAASRKAIVRAREARAKKLAYSKTLAGIPTDPEDDDPLGVLEFMIKREVGKKPHGVMVEPVVGGATTTYVEPAADEKKLATQPAKDEKKATPKLPKRKNNVKPPAAAQSKVSSDESESEASEASESEEEEPPTPVKSKRKPKAKPAPVETAAPPPTQRAAGPAYTSDHSWATSGISYY